tara:strand:- start:201 stop:443 length:243 start_codon:yes stop_codon:yes gene_type:complete
MELHVRTSEGTFSAVIKGKTAIALKEKLSHSMDFDSKFKTYSCFNLDNVLTYKALCNSPITIGDMTFMFWTRDYIYVVMK